MGVCVTVCVTTEPDLVVTSTVVLGVAVGVGELDVDDGLETGALETGSDDGDGGYENEGSAYFCNRESDGDKSANSDDV